MTRTLLCAVALIITTPWAPAAQLVHSFQKVRATDQFWAEGADIADFNKDGQVDVVSGCYWYAGPDFQKRHEIYPATASWKRKKTDGSEEVLPGYEGALGENNAYSDCFLTYTHDFNQDGWADVVVYPHPGNEVPVYVNPKGQPGHWQKHIIFDVLDNESPGFEDVTGDGKPELICNSKGYLGYAAADWSDALRPWTFHAISPKGNWQKYSHGIGVGDINGDGRKDFIETEGWWEQPSSLAGDPVWKKHPYKFGDGGAQMLVYDVNGDGLNDVITTIRAHEYGLSWFEQVKDASGGITFREHTILNRDAKPNRYGVQFSQVHALTLIDMDKDGVLDLVTGKRFWAHGKNGPDPESNAPAVLYWFKITRPAPGQAEFVPFLVDEDSGVGTQVTAGYVSNREYPDIVVGNKKGVFVFKHSAKAVSREEWEKAQPKAR